MEAIPIKKSLCRFYLRGLCVFPKQECQFSHGIWDLDYDYWNEDEVIQYDYQKSKDDVQKNIIKGPRIYRNLYEFQQEKVLSLQEINQNRPLRAQIRNMMHQQLYLQFIELLQIKHPGTPLTEEFLLRQFTRVGFNKILNGVIKFSHITSYVCDTPGSKYFKITKIVPPNPVKQGIIIRKAIDEDIVACYKGQYKRIMEKADKQIEESILKKQLFTAKLPQNIPLLNQVLKDKKMNLITFIKKCLEQDTSLIVLEASVDVIEEEALKYLKEKLPLGLVTWNQVYNHLTKALKTNNGNIINQVKPNLILQNNFFLFFPSTQFIYSPEFNPHIFKQLNQIPCKCPYQKPFSEEQLLLDMKKIKQLKEGESYDIHSFQTLMACAADILNSEVLGVDLEGNLRKGGFVQMVQLNNGKNTFLFDIWYMNEKGDFETFWLSRKVLRNVMTNPKIVKIFHDCRHDSIGLHEMIETCIVNVFDTSACQTLIMQLNLYQKLMSKKKQVKDIVNEGKNILGQCTNVKTPGLNQILKKYEARHGINQNKEKYHKMWSKGEHSFFCKRPIDPDYREYCIKDVLDLPEVYQKMMACIPEQARQMAFWVSGLYAKSGYLPE